MFYCRSVPAGVAARGSRVRTDKTDGGHSHSGTSRAVARRRGCTHRRHVYLLTSLEEKCRNFLNDETRAKESEKFESPARPAARETTN